jgi:hypothetical protein
MKRAVVWCSVLLVMTVGLWLVIAQTRQRSPVVSQTELKRTQRQPESKLRRSETATKAATTPQEGLSEALAPNLNLPVLLQRIRSLPAGEEKDDGLATLLRVRDRRAVATLSEALAVESDRILRDHEVLLLQQIIDAEGVQHLVEMLDAAAGQHELQELYLSVFDNISSPAGLVALQGLVRSNDFPVTEPLLFMSLRSLARSGRVGDIQAVFDCIDRHEGLNRNELGILTTAAVDVANPDAVSVLTKILDTDGSVNNRSTQIVAIYALRNFRDDNDVADLLRSLSASGDRDVAAAASEALTTSQ